MKELEKNLVDSILMGYYEYLLWFYTCVTIFWRIYFSHVTRKYILQIFAGWEKKKVFPKTFSRKKQTSGIITLNGWT